MHIGAAQSGVAGQGAGDWLPWHPSDLSVKRPAYARSAPPMWVCHPGSLSVASL